MKRSVCWRILAITHFVVAEKMKTGLIVESIPGPDTAPKLPKAVTMGESSNPEEREQAAIATAAREKEKEMSAKKGKKK